MSYNGEEMKRRDSFLCYQCPGSQRWGWVVGAGGGQGAGSRDADQSLCPCPGRLTASIPSSVEQG